MQTYLVSILLRTNTGRVGLLFYLLLIGISVSPSLASVPNPIEKDTLFTQWAKTKSTLPTIFYELADFNDFSDRVEAESLIRMYGIGGVIIPNGDLEDVKKWVKENGKWRKEPLIHIASIDQIFQLPFQGLPAFPNHLSVTCYTDDSLVYQLARGHAQVLKSLGIGMVQISNIPAYYSKHEWRKVQMYLHGLTDAKISFYFSELIDRNVLPDISSNGLKSILISAMNIEASGVLEKKSVKKYQKKTGDQRIVFDRTSDHQATLKQIENGVGFTIVSRQDKPQSLGSYLLTEGVPDKGFYRNLVKDYIQLYHKVEQGVANTDSLLDWENFLQRFELTDITLTKDLNNLLPLGDLREIEFVTISNKSSFELSVAKYKSAKHFSPSVLQIPIDSLTRLLPQDAVLLVDLTAWEKENQNEIMVVCDSLSGMTPVLVFLEGNPEILKNSNRKAAVIWNPEDSRSRLNVMVEMVFGGRAIYGALPGYFQEDETRKGIITAASGRLIYSSKNTSDVNKQILDQIDTLVAHAIREKMMPGCQIMMVKDGQVVYDKTFGHLTYDSLTSVRWDHVYDIASVTKTVATVPALMQRMDKGKVRLDGFLGDYLSDIDTTKSKLLVDDILTHQSGLKSYIPFWRNAKYFSDSANFLYKKRKWRRKYSYHSINWNDSIQSWITSSSYNSLSNNDGTYRYLYSDLGFMLMKDLVEENCQCAFDQSMDQLLYQPMGMNFTTFNPLNRFPKEQIAPTEEDKYFRSELLQGIVHDKNAALLGGVSGHAGLFSNANDLAKYMQMLLQGGSYGGVRYFSDSTVQIFTSKKNENDRRAMGWDKPYPSVGNASKYASEESFGHSGFTGTLVWADPKYNLVYIFLSNRIYPDPQNYKLIESNTRTKIHNLMYESFLNVRKETRSGS